MLSLNRAQIIGNLTRDPELRYTPNGQAVASFAVATNRAYMDASGEKKESVEFHDIVTWGKLAEICQQLLSKGRKVYIEGRLQTRSWEGQDGVKRQKTEIVAENMLVLDKPKEWATGGAPMAQSAPQSAPASNGFGNDMGSGIGEGAPMPDVSIGGGEVNLDDIPF
jgi:single-strand DNA-binding protein